MIQVLFYHLALAGALCLQDTTSPKIFLFIFFLPDKGCKIRQKRERKKNWKDTLVLLHCSQSFPFHSALTGWWVGLQFISSCIVKDALYQMNHQPDLTYSFPNKLWIWGDSSLGGISALQCAQLVSIPGWSALFECFDTTGRFIAVFPSLSELKH